MIELHGDDHYSWGKGENSPSWKQKRVIEHINAWMDTQGIDSKFPLKGSTSDEAYAWIGVWRRKAPKLPPLNQVEQISMNF